jgi:hypothetical protein
MQRTYLKIVLFVLRYVSSIPEKFTFHMSIVRARLYRSEEDMPSFLLRTFCLAYMQITTQNPPPKRINNSQSTYLVILRLNCSPF